MVKNMYICMYDFEWDEAKNIKNIETHNVSFEVAKEAFYDKKHIIKIDEKHSEYENRYYCVGNDGNGIVTVRFTIRNGNIRIFGAGYWRGWKKLYEEKYEKESNLHCRTERHFEKLVKR